PFLRNNTIYLVIELWERSGVPLESWTPRYVLLEVPAAEVGRFVVLPKRGDTDEVMFLDDVIRFNLGRLFPDHEVGRSYAVKLTRDAELYLEDEFEGDLVEGIRQGLKKREQ